MKPLNWIAATTLALTIFSINAEAAQKRYTQRPPLGIRMCSAEELDSEEGPGNCIETRWECRKLAGKTLCVPFWILHLGIERDADDLDRDGN